MRLNGNPLKSKEPGQLVLFWDYDTQWGADRSRISGGPKTWGLLEFENTDRLLELHAEYDVPACFAVVGSAALPGERPYHDPVQIRRIHEAGHEVASHSHRHEWLPGLGPVRLCETLAESKDALEQCIGARVTTFVPPWNEPFDYAAGWSFSLSERREARGDRTDLRRLCAALGESGYRFCRVAYRPLLQRVTEQLLGRRLDHRGQMETIAGITCVRLNTPGGFDDAATTMIERVSRDGGLAVVYGHPHSLHASNSQDERRLIPFLDRVRELRDEGRLRPMLPRDVLTTTVVT